MPNLSFEDEAEPCAVLDLNFGDEAERRLELWRCAKLELWRCGGANARVEFRSQKTRLDLAYEAKPGRPDLISHVRWSQPGKSYLIF